MTKKDDNQKEVKINSLLNLYVMNYEHAVDLRQATMNRMRCWLRDTLPKELWPKKKRGNKKKNGFNDEFIMNCDFIPNDLRDSVAKGGHLLEMEKKWKELMSREVEKHPLWPWIGSIYNMSHSIAGKLLHRINKHFPSPAHLWSYAGLDGPGWRKRSHNWELTSVCYLIAEQIQITPDGESRYRDIYDERKEYERSKPWCGKCHTKKENELIKEIEKLKEKSEKLKDEEEKARLEKQAAEKNTELKNLEDKRGHCTPAHSNNKARRYAVKEFLKDLWVKREELGLNKCVVQEQEEGI